MSARTDVERQAQDARRPLPPAPRTSHARTFTRGFLAKVVLMALVNAFGVYVILAAWAAESYGVMGVMIALVLAADYVYFSRRTLPMKYLLPGLAFLLVYQVFVVGYTGYVALTNYGDGHNSTKEDAVEALLIQKERRVEGFCLHYDERPK